MRSKKAYTLIEVLISLAIFSLIVSLISYALSQGLNQYKDVTKRTSSFWERAKILWLQKSFGSIIDYYVKDEEWFPFFEGTSEYIVYITESPLANNIPVVVFLVNERNENGKRNLVYYELPVLTKDYRELLDYIKFEKYRQERGIILLKDMESLRFEFFGSDFLKLKADWYSNFSGKEKKLLPQFIKISYKSITSENMELIFLVRNNSLIKQIYNEIYP